MKHYYQNMPEKYKYIVKLEKKSIRSFTVTLEHDTPDSDEIADLAWEAFNKSDIQPEDEYITKVKRIY